MIKLIDILREIKVNNPTVPQNFEDLKAKMTLSNLNWVHGPSDFQYLEDNYHLEKFLPIVKKYRITQPQDLVDLLDLFIYGRSEDEEGNVLDSFIIGDNRKTNLDLEKIYADYQENFR